MQNIVSLVDYLLLATFGLWLQKNELSFINFFKLFNNFTRVGQGSINMMLPILFIFRSKQLF